MNVVSREKLERGLVESEKLLTAAREKYEATGKYDVSVYAEAYGFLAAAVRGVLAREAP